MSVEWKSPEECEHPQSLIVNGRCSHCKKLVNGQPLTNASSVPKDASSGRSEAVGELPLRISGDCIYYNGYRDDEYHCLRTRESEGEVIIIDCRECDFGKANSQPRTGKDGVEADDSRPVTLNKEVMKCQ
jgi:hypothetical protein